MSVSKWSNQKKTCPSSEPPSFEFPEDLRLVQIVSQFYEHLLFGTPFERDTLPPRAALIIRHLERRLPTEKERPDVQRDLDRLLQGMQTQNLTFFRSTKLAEDSGADPRFETTLVQNFYHRLSIVTGGSLDQGLSSNRFVYQTLKAAYYRESRQVPTFQQFVAPLSTGAASGTDLQLPVRPEDLTDDEAILRHFLTANAPVDEALVFRDAHFWGSAFKNLLEKRHMTVWCPTQRHLDAIQKHYSVTCYAFGRLVDPFALRLDAADTVDPEHWQTPSRLLAFLKTQPTHPLSQAVKALQRRLLNAVFEARPLDELPQDYRHFLSNVRLADDALPKVSSTCLPPVLVDVFHRLLALTKYDVLWQENPEPWKASALSEEFFDLYLYTLALQNEISGLKQLLLSGPANHGQQFRQSARPPPWMKRAWEQADER